MNDYVVSDKVANSSSTTKTSNASQNANKNSQSQTGIQDKTVSSQGKTATEQQLPQTGIIDNTPQLMFGSSCFLLVIAIMIKLVSMHGDSDA